MADYTQDSQLNKINKWKQESEDLRKRYEYRWAKNIKLLKGIFQEETSYSTVRNRKKIFFRKTWATVWRILASLYHAFLKDKDSFRIEGRDTINDYLKARILQKMTEYRRDKMMRNNSLFIKFMWAFQNILNLGWTVGKLRWDYRVVNNKVVKDEPAFIVYPNEQVFPDFSAETREQMRYIGFLNYMSKAEMEENDYENIKDMEETTVETTTLRQTRYMESGIDPLQNPKTTGDYNFPRGHEYPEAGKYADESRDIFSRVYKVFEWFYKEDGKIKYCVTGDNKIWLKKPKDSPYGNDYENIIMGNCLIEAHKLIGEGFPEPLEAPQESYNYNLNMRKDNVALSMTKQAIVARYGNVDLQSLVNRRVSGYTIADDVNAVKYEEVPDVTSGAYLEAVADEGMMDEISGVTPSKRGMEKTNKATVARINYTEANAKQDLYIAIVGETFVRDFYSGLAKMIQKFESNETIFRIANDSLRLELNNPFMEEIYNLDFEADCIINVGVGTVSRDMEIKQTILLMDRAIMSNQASAALLKAGAVPPEGVRLIDITKFMEAILPKLGFKNLKELFFTATPSRQRIGRGQNPALAGRVQPQIGNLNIPTEAEM